MRRQSATTPLLDALEVLRVRYQNQLDKGTSHSDPTSYPGTEPDFFPTFEGTVRERIQTKLDAIDDLIKKTQARSSNQPGARDAYAASIEAAQKALAVHRNGTTQTPGKETKGHKILRKALNQQDRYDKRDAGPMRKCLLELDIYYENQLATEKNPRKRVILENKLYAVRETTNFCSTKKPDNCGLKSQDLVKLGHALQKEQRKSGVENPDNPTQFASTPLTTGAMQLNRAINLQLKIDTTLQESLRPQNPSSDDNHRP